ncbi:MAG TPA: hypothetical protein VJ521_06275 [Acidobacteriota bacterium]|nr:hypothetical protein [Acidobacteriota bacterium]
MKNIHNEFGTKKNKSKFIEETAREYIRRRVHRKPDLADLDILNKKAAKLNKEASDVLSYQANL